MKQNSGGVRDIELEVLEWWLIVLAKICVVPGPAGAAISLVLVGGTRLQIIPPPHYFSTSYIHLTYGNPQFSAIAYFYNLYTWIIVLVFAELKLIPRGSTSTETKFEAWRQHLDILVTDSRRRKFATYLRSRRPSQNFFDRLDLEEGSYL